MKWPGRQGLGCASLLLAGAFMMSAPQALAQRVFLEDFEGLALGPNQEEALNGSKVWTKTPPAGWVIDDSKMPGVGDAAQNGITEWAGWSFANKNWWVTTAGDQRRTEFVFGTGAVMIADPDEWDDAAHAQGLFESTIKTKAISLAGAAANTLVLFYDSSWRPEATDDGLPNFPVNDEGTPINNQTGFITAQFDSGSTNEVQRWTSVADEATYHDHLPNESILIELNNPAGAQNVTLTIGMEKAANDWWWAVDNIAIGAPPFGVGIVADGVSFRARIVEALGITVDQSKPIIVELDGAAITGAQFVREEPLFLVDYTQAPQIFQPGTTHTVKVKYASSANKAMEDTFTFVAPGYTAATATPVTVTATIADAPWLTVDETKPIALELDGAAVTGATVARSGASVIARFVRATPFVPESSHNLKVAFVTTDGATVVDPVAFIAPKVTVIPAELATAAGTGVNPGMNWRTHQLATARGTTVALAEQQLAGALGESVHDTSLQEADGFFHVDVVNFDQNAGEAGNFNASAPEPQNVEDGFIPGIPGQGTDNIAAEALAFVEIPAAGIYTMVVNSDDGFRVSVGTTNSPIMIELGKYDGGRGQADSEFYFLAESAGVYFVRLLYFEGGSDARVEWFTVNTDGSRALVNGTQPDALKAYRARAVPEPNGSANNIASIARQGGSVVITYTGVLKSASEAVGPYAVVNGAASPATITATETRQFFIAQ